MYITCSTKVLFVYYCKKGFIDKNRIKIKHYVSFLRALTKCGYELIKFYNTTSVNVLRKHSDTVVQVVALILTFVRSISLQGTYLLFILIFVIRLRVYVPVGPPRLEQRNVKPSFPHVIIEIITIDTYF